MLFANRGTHAACNPDADAVEPRSQRIPDMDRAGLSDEDQKRALERIVRVGWIRKDAPADTQDHGPMSRDQG